MLTDEAGSTFRAGMTAPMRDDLQAPPRGRRDVSRATVRLMVEI
jgi:hypothetical protein